MFDAIQSAMITKPMRTLWAAGGSRRAARVGQIAPIPVRAPMPRRTSRRTSAHAPLPSAPALLRAWATLPLEGLRPWWPPTMQAYVAAVRGSAPYSERNQSCTMTWLSVAWGILSG